MRALTRRSVMVGLAGAAAAGAPSHMVTAKTFPIGAIKATVLSDGHMMVGLDRLAATGMDTAFFDTLRTAEKLDAGPHRFAVNITLLEFDGKRILIDAGAGGTWVDTAGKLADTLAATGIDPNSIDHVALTHAHPDHLWGVVDDFDNTLRFPKATYSIPTAEFEFWMSPTAPENARAAEGVTAGARRILKMLEPKLKRVAAEDTFLPGLAYVDAKGHTPGQCAVLATSGTSRLLVAADTIFHPVISVQYPHWQPAQDMDGAQAAQSRRKLLDLAVTLQAAVVAYHVASPGLGRIERRGTALTWVNT